MKKLSNNNGVIKSSTLAGQRELLREYRNKINEIIEEYDARFQTHEDRINLIAEDKGENMKQTPIPEKIKVITEYKAENTINSLIDVLTQQQKEIKELQQDLKSLTTEVHVNLDQPYTAMRSTGECVRCGHNHEQDDFAACNCCNTLAPKYVKPQTDKILAIVKGE